MKTVLLNDKQRKKIVNLVRPKENDYYSYQNLNLLTAVFDEDTKIYLTLAYYLSSSIKRTDEHYDDYTYVMLTPMGNYVVGCKEEAGNYKGIFSPLPVLISNKKILELIEYYRHSFSERFSMEKEAKKEMDLEGKGFTEWYLEKHYFEKKQKYDSDYKMSITTDIQRKEFALKRMQDSQRNIIIEIEKLSNRPFYFMRYYGDDCFDKYLLRGAHSLEDSNIRQ